MSITVAFIGDSITYGYPYGPDYSWVNLLQELMPGNFEGINLGTNGDSLINMQRRFKRDVINLDAAYVHILGGANDAWLNNEPTLSQNAVDAMIKECRAAGIRPVIGLTTPLCPNPAVGSSFVPFGLEEMIIWLDQFRKWLISYAFNNSVPVIDYYTALCLPGLQQGDPANFHDECHLNAQGNRVMAHAAKIKLKEIIF